MANSSDSDDFESADEDFAEECPAVVPSLKDNCQKELNKLQNTSSLSEESQSVQPSKLIPEPDLNERDDSNTTPPESPVREPPADKKRRQQKVREAKLPAKLGTRIASPSAEVPPSGQPIEVDSEEIDPDPFAQFRGYSMPPTVEQCWEPDDGENSIPDDQPASIPKETNQPNPTDDPYAKFRGYSQPPLMEKCWETDDNGKPILDNQPVKNPETKDKAAEVDPYAKFRGFSKPPLMQRCWVTDSAGKPILDDHVSKVTERLDTVERPKVEEEPSIATNEEDEEGDVDPFAMFRGYTVEPEKETGWEDDVDDVEIDDDEEATNKVELDSPAISKNEEEDEGDVDPFAMFRGYTVEPEKETGWEDDVDDVEIDDDEVETNEVETEEKQPGAKPITHQEAPETKTAPAAPTSSGFGWGGWGVTSLLATATESVASLTSQVSSALEAGIGAPDPIELARRDRLEEKLLGEMAAGEPCGGKEEGVPPGEQGEASGVFGFVSSFTKLVESTGTKVLTGGLDTLESIGKKTMEVLQEGDPGLKKKRAMFTDKTVLSQILREAKDKAEVEDKEAEVKQAERAVHFETLFDDYQGLVHLEALEMLSKQCELKLQALALASVGPVLNALQRRLKEVRDSCQLPEDEDEAEEAQEGRWLDILADAEKQLGVPIAIGKLDEIVTESREWLDDWTSNGTDSTRSAAHARAVSTLARLTAASAEQFHKTAEMLLVKEQRDASVEAQALITVTTVLCAQVSTAATRFCEALNGVEAKPAEDVNAAITSIFLEASNSSSYIQEAFQLLIPVLQVGSAL